MDFEGRIKVIEYILICLKMQFIIIKKLAFIIKLIDNR